ncbi:MAG: hypothetical protein HQL67_06540 [Magnetococcales bacterium]|nr:hypothetical protein [Magnetococcales bacterium]
MMDTVQGAWGKPHFTPEQLLWSAVLESALSDALSHRDPEEKARAIRWFQEGGQHFQMVCDLANYEWSFVRKRVLMMVNAHETGSLN